MRNSTSNIYAMGVDRRKVIIVSRDPHGPDLDREEWNDSVEASRAKIHEAFGDDVHILFVPPYWRVEVVQ